MENEGMSLDKLNKWKILLGVMDLLYKSNKNNKRVENIEFVNETCSTEINLQKATKEWYENKKRKDKKSNIFTALDYPWLFNLISKVDI